MIHPHLTIDHVKQLEHQVIIICSHCTTLDELTAAGTPLLKLPSVLLEHLNRKP